MQRWAWSGKGPVPRNARTTVALSSGRQKLRAEGFSEMVFECTVPNLEFGIRTGRRVSGLIT
jgi:hypothetical protein